MPPPSAFLSWRMWETSAATRKGAPGMSAIVVGRPAAEMARTARSASWRVQWPWSAL